VRPTLFAHRLEWLMLACNFRLATREQAMLEFSDVDLVHEFIHVQTKPDLGFLIKNYQDRYIPLVPEVRPAVEAMLASRKPSTLSRKDGKLVPVDFIFHPPDGSPWGDLADSMDSLFTDTGLNSKGTRRRDRITLRCATRSQAGSRSPACRCGGFRNSSAIKVLSPRSGTAIWARTDGGYITASSPKRWRLVL
jgi:hypothetical protein